MKKINVLFVLMLLIGSRMMAQETKLQEGHYQAIITLNDGTTKEGIILASGYSLDPSVVSREIIFVNKEDYSAGKFNRKAKQDYSPKDLKSFVIDGKTFEAHEFADMSSRIPVSKPAFLELIANGKIKQLSLWKSESIQDNRTVEEKLNDPKYNRSVVSLPAIFKEGDKRSRSATKGNIEDYIQDNPEILKKYKEGGYLLKDDAPKALKALGKMGDTIGGLTGSLPHNFDLKTLISEYNAASVK
jgi:hypothetical protein